VLLPRRQQVLPAAGGPWPADSALGAPLRVPADERFRPHPARARTRAAGRMRVSAPAPQARGLVPTIGWRHGRYTRRTDPTNWKVDRLWKPGDSIQLARGDKKITAKHP